MAKQVQSEVKKVSRIKVKKKNWYKIIAPKIFGNKEIGESYLSSAENAIGRKMKLNLKDITGNVKDQNIYIGFQVTKANGSMLNTSIVSYEIIPSAVKRMIRKMTSRLDDAFKFRTKGGKEVILKSIIITLHTAQRSTERQLRKELKNYLNEDIGKTGFDNFVNNLVSGKVQVILRKRLNKIFPVKELGIKVFKLNSNDLASEELLAEVSNEDTSADKEERNNIIDKKSEEEA